MTALELAGGVLAVAFAALLLSSMGYTGWRLLSTVGIIGIYLFTVGRIELILESLFGTSLSSGVGEVAEVAVKMVGLGYVFGMVSELLRTLGQSELASGVEVAGRVEIFALSLPYLTEIIKMITGYISI